MSNMPELIGLTRHATDRVDVPERSVICDESARIERTEKNCKGLHADSGRSHLRASTVSIIGSTRTCSLKKSIHSRYPTLSSIVQ